MKKLIIVFVALFLLVTQTLAGYDFTYERGWDLDAYMVGGIAAMGDGNVYVAISQPGMAKIRKYDWAGLNLISEFGTEGSGLGQFTNPQGIALGKNNNIFVADAGHKVLKFKPDGTFIREFGDSSTGPYIAANRDTGDIYVASYPVTGQAQIVKQYSNDGNFLRNWSLSGTAVGQMFKGLAVGLNNNVYVAINVDASTSKIQKYNRNGSFVREWKVKPLLAQPNNIPEGYITSLGASKITGDIFVGLNGCESDIVQSVNVYDKLGNYRESFKIYDPALGDTDQAAALAVTDSLYVYINNGVSRGGTAPSMSVKSSTTSGRVRVYLPYRGGTAPNN